MDPNIKRLELLAPAKDFESGKAAIDCGADAIYTGYKKYGARSAAGNSLSDIENLVNYSRKYFAKVYCTVNTVLFDDELEDVQKLILKLYECGVSALIIQDMGIMEMNLPNIPVFASTQAHNNSIEKIIFLEKNGFSRVILPRETSLEEIQEIKKNTSIELESFVHGALCVCYSGQCYFSQALGLGSANRGACAQPCRAYYSIYDQKGNIIVKDKYVLSLKDLDLSTRIQDLALSGISSFKIEGRLKDVSYVKNITSLYRKKIDYFLEHNSFYEKSSSGKVSEGFTPDPDRTFSRERTEYLIDKRRKGLTTFNTQKSVGKKIGTIKDVGATFFTIETDEKISNGDGLCYFSEDSKINGIRVNRTDGNKIFSDSINDLKPGTTIYRNYDKEFIDNLEIESPARYIDVQLTLSDTEEGFSLTATDEDGITGSRFCNLKKEPAQNRELSEKNFVSQLSKSGGTIFKITAVQLPDQAWFAPISVINNLRRDTLNDLLTARLKSFLREIRKLPLTDLNYFTDKISYKGNVTNKLAEQFYKKRGVKIIEPGVDGSEVKPGTEIMESKYCMRFELGLCNGKNNPAANEELILKDNNRSYRVVFDCEKCIMKIIM